MWDPVPWFVGGGAEHSPEVARTLAYASTNGSEGVIDTASLKVTALDVPGGSVAVGTGACLIRNRAVGGERQTYAGRATSVDYPQIAATDASGKRSDLVVTRVEDPNMAGEPWQDPEDPIVGPYIFTRVIPNVPAGTKRLRDVPGYEGNSAIALARVDVPASTAAITNAMITDLRKVAQPRSQRQLFNIEPAVVNNNTAAYTNWPQETIAIDVPEWATKIVVKLDVFGAMDNTDIDGTFRITLGDQQVQVQDFSLNGTGAAQRMTFTVAGSAGVATAQRGTTQTLKMQAKRSGGTGNIRTVVKGFYIADVEFYEVPV